MDCSASIDTDGEAPKVKTQKIVKARKNHICSECKRVIEKKEEYESFRGYWEYLGWNEYKTCSDCLSIRKVFFESFCFECLYDDLIDYISNTYGEIPEDCISPLTPRAKDKVCDLIERYWEISDLS